MRLIQTIRPRVWGLVLFSAVLQVFCFPTGGPMPAWGAWLSWVAVAPFLVALLSLDRNGRELTGRQGAVLGYVCGVLWYLGNCSWIYQTMYLYGGMEKPVAFLILILFSLYLGLYHALFGWLVALVRRSAAGLAGGLLLAPFLWVAVELARARVTGFPWDLLGYAQVDNLLVTRMAPVTGVMGISLLLIGVNAGVAAGLMLRGRRHWMLSAGALLLALALQWAGSARYVRGLPTGDQFAVMVQENLSVGAERKGVRALTPAEELSIFSAMSKQPIAPAGSGKTTVVIWPEAPSDLQSNHPDFQVALSSLATSVHAPVIAGSLGVDLNPAAAKGYYLFDSASVFSEEGRFLGRYDKIHLVPWGEYVPFKEVFFFASKLTAGAGNMDPGKVRSMFRSDGRSYGIFVCYESIFGDEVREFVKNGAEVLVNISDDGWYGDTGAPWQHLNMARMRAIENDRWVLRDTNTGVTTSIDPLGRYSDMPRHVRVAYELPFGFESGLTFYTKYGDWLAWVCVLVSLGGLCWGYRRHQEA